MLKLRRNPAPFTLFLVLGTLVCGSAWAVPLDQLDDGTVPFIDSGSGELRFSSFSAIPSGDLPADLSAYDISSLLDGLTITGPFNLSDGQAGTLLIEFDVSILVGGLMLEGADLDFSGTVTDSLGGAFASVTEDLLDGPGGSPIAGDADLGVFASANGPFIESDSAVFTPVLTLHVLKDIDVTTILAGQTVVISSIDQAFLVPEPGTAAILALGLAGLAALGRRS